MKKFLPMSLVFLLSTVTLLLNAQLNNTALGTSANVLTVAESNTTTLDANNSLGALTFIHRNDPTLLGGNSSQYRFDVSKDNGTTWDNNLGPINSGAALNNTAFARFPQGIIFNPANNLIDDSAYLIYSGTYHDNSTWVGQNRGRGKLTGITSTFNSSFDPINSNRTLIGASLCQGAPGVFWAVNVNDNTSSLATLPSTSTITGISVQKGVYSTSTRNVTWTTTTLPVTFAKNSDGNSQCTSWNIAFDPTGQYGWISVLGDITLDADSVLNPIFWKTTNFGNTWSAATQVDLDNIGGIKDYMDTVDYTQATASRIPTTTFDSDLSVDYLGNPHLLTLVASSASDYRIQYAGFEVWDITYSASAPCPWYGNLFSKTYTLRGTYSAEGQTDDNRPQICRTTDGTKLFFTWTSTDADRWLTINNEHPNLIMVGLDIPSGARTGVFNVTATDTKWSGGTASATVGSYGGVPFTVIGQTAIDIAPTYYTIPTVLTQMDYANNGAIPNVSSEAPAAHFYVDNLIFADGDFLYFSDIINPVITLNGANPMNLTVGQTYNEPGATAFDCADGNLTVDITGTVNTNVAGTYTIQYVATDASENSDTVYRTVIVTGGTGSAPTVVTLPATNVSSSGATLNGTVNANNLSTTVSFQYGLTTSYGSTATGVPSPVTGNTAQAVSASISGLSPNTTYHFRARGVNTSGTNFGIDRTFTTTAQGTPCTPNPNTTQGLEPKAASVNCITRGTSFSQVYTFVVPPALTAPPFTISSMTIDSIVNLPAGLTWAASVNPPTYAGGTSGCFTVSGVTNDACGQYTMLIYVTVVTQIGPFSGELTQLTNQFGVAGYEQEYLRVISSGNACPAVNTSPSGNFEAYATCASGGGITVTLSQTPVNCFGQSTGSVTSTVSGGTNYTYQWSNGSFSPNISNVAAGNYRVTVTSGTSTATATIDVLQPASALSVSATSTPSSCTGNTGSATATAVGGTANYTYAWTPSGSGATITNRAAGNYTVTATDSKGCTASTNVTISSNTGLSVSVTTTAVNCFGGSTGSATATTTGNTGNVTYNWSRGTGNTNTVTNVSAGAITVTASDAGSGCSASATATIAQPASALSVSTTTTPTTCTGTTGSATATATGGNTNYTYNWTPTASGATISNRGAGNYTVTVTDNKNCTASTTATISSVSNLTVSITPTAVNCFGGQTGSASATATGNSGNVTYNWSSNVSGVTATGLSAGSITVTATDAGGCSATATATITQPAAPLVVTASSTGTSCTSNTGTATATATGGTSTYNYTWNNSNSGATIANLGVGTYIVTVTDSKSCTASATTTVASPATFTLTVSTVAVNCFGQSTGSATASVTGATGTVNYAWNVGPNTAQLNNQPAGTYTVTATDGNGCSKSASGTITQPAVPLAVTVSTTSSTCGASTGTATATVTGNSGNPVYSWSGGTGSTTATISSLSAGIYNVTVTAGNCSATAAAAVNNSNGPTLSILTTNPSCFGSSNGSATAVPSGGQQPYNYIWSNNNGGPSITGVIAGTYTVIVTDNGGCAATRVVTLTQPDAITFNPTITNVNCNSALTGSVSVAVGGGTGPYQYGWSNLTSQNAINNVAAGSYTLTVSDSKSCTAVNTFTVTQPTAISVTTSSTPSACGAGTSTGTATANATGGQGNFNFAWSNSTSGSTINNLAAGPYIVTVTDGNGCTATATTTVTTPTTFTMVVNTTAVTCNGLSTGIATAVPTGATGNVTYVWSPTGSTASLSQQPAGAYTVTATDGNGCVVTATGTITEPATLTVAVSTGNGTATATPAGGNTPYSYAWSGTAQTTATATGLAAGSATVTVTDSKGCTATASGTVVISGVEETTLANTVIMVYPNPASDVLNVDVELTKTHNVQLRVTDATGKEVFVSQQTASGSFKQPLNTSTYAAGVYVLEVKLDKYSTYRRIVIGR